MLTSKDFQRDIGMVAQKNTETIGVGVAVCMQALQTGYTNTIQVTLSLNLFFLLTS